MIGPRQRRDERREAAGGDDGAGVAELGEDALDQPVDQADVAVDDARLHRVDGVAPDDLRRLGDLDARELGRAREERVGADLQARREDAAEVLALGRHAVEVRRGAEVDDDDAALGPLEARDRVGDAVGADLARVLDEDGHARADPGADDERLAPEGAASRGASSAR